MDYYDKRLLSDIQRFNAYCDEKSLEKTTGLEKRKYKLAAKFLIEFNSYPFFIFTTEPEACQGDLRFCVAKKDWLNRKSGYLEEPYSYTDLNNKVEILEPEEVLKKIKDRENGFLKVAKLCQNKCIELQQLIPNLLKSKRRILPETKKIVGLGVLDEGSIAFQIFKKLISD